MKITAIIYALLAAVFYAVNVPVSKILLERIGPTFMAAFLYLGAGLGMGALALAVGRRDDAEKLTKADLPYTLGMIVLDIAAPIFLMIGIGMGSPSNASLLGNFEIVATTLIAFLVFREAVSRRLWSAVLLITLSSIILSFDGLDGTGGLNGGESLRFSAGSLFVLAATVCWGLENNCTRSLSSKSAYEIVILKGLFSGMGSFLIALFIGESMPAAKDVLVALLLGFVSYGLSIFLYVRAQRTLGAAKTSAFYAAAPFVGAFLSFVLIGERLTANYLTALLIMIAGTSLAAADTLVRSHSHVHTHTVTHTHDHTTHTHVITHAHEHDHYLTLNRHGHRHTLKELGRP